MPLFATASNPPLQGRYVTVADRKVHYHLSGEGTPVLLLHGNGSLGEEILSPFHDCPGFTWIAPDRPGYGFSEPLAAEDDAPSTIAHWALDLLDVLGHRKVILVAHSIAAAPAIHLAAKAPERVSGLVLLAPFCRPTPHRWMLGLRLAVAPGVGMPVRRYLLPALLPLFRTHVLESVMEPNPVPPWLKRFPVEHAARSRALRTMARELRSFNDGMSDRAGRLRVDVPTHALFGLADETAEPSWHEPWLRRHAPCLTVVRLPGVGHAVHHADPAAALRMIREADVNPLRLTERTMSPSAPPPATHRRQAC